MFLETSLADAPPDGLPYDWVLLGAAPPIYLFSVVVFVPLLILGVGLLSAAKTAFGNLSEDDVEQLRYKPDAKDLKVLKLLRKPDYLYATTTVGRYIIYVVVSVVSTLALKDWLVLSSATTLEEGMFYGNMLLMVCNVLIITFFLSLFGNLLPKSYAQNHAVAVARGTSGGLLLLGTLLFPFNYVLVWVTQWLSARWTAEKKEEETLVVVTSDIAAKDHVPNEVKLKKSVSQFGQVLVKQIMTNRGDAVAIDSACSYREVLDRVQEYAYSRFPIVVGDFDHIKGILYAKDLLKLVDTPNREAWHTLLREPYFVPETQKIGDLLGQFQEKRVHIAIVVDEYGEMAGLVTLEDVLEEIFGEIKDEHDDIVEIEYKQYGEHLFFFEGKTPINDFCRIVGVEVERFDDVRGDADSLAGLLLELAGEMPEVNEEIAFEEFVFTTTVVDGRRIQQIKVVRTPEPSTH